MPRHAGLCGRPDSVFSRMGPPDPTSLPAGRGSILEPINPAQIWAMSDSLPPGGQVQIGQQGRAGGAVASSDRRQEHGQGGARGGQIREGPVVATSL